MAISVVFNWFHPPMRLMCWMNLALTSFRLRDLDAPPQVRVRSLSGMEKVMKRTLKILG